MEEKVFDGTTSIPNRPEDGCIALINGLILILMVLTQVFGDLWLSHGMKAFGAVQSLTPHAVFNLIGYLLTSPSIVLGVITLVLSLGLHLVAISRFDLSYVRPTTALTYAVSLLSARYVLHEQVVPGRLMGSLVMGLGIFLVALT